MNLQGLWRGSVGVSEESMNAKKQDDELKCRNAMRTLTRRAGCLIPCLLAFLLIRALGI